MPWCSFPWHKLLPRLAQKNCCINLIDEFASLFSPKAIFAGSLRKAFPQNDAFVDISVFLWLGKQRPRFAQGQPKGYFQLKELHRTAKVYCSNECWLKGGEGEVCWVQCANMWQDCSLTAVQRKTAFVEHSWWPELKMFGSMPWCSFPWHKLLPRLAQKNCCINLIDEFTSLLSPNVKVIFAGLLSLWTSVFFRGRASNSQDSPKASPRAIFKWKNSVEPLQLLSQWMTGGENWMPTCANMCHYVPAWANIAVCQLCRKRQPLWSSHDGLNLTCLDQCDGVRSPGISSSQGRRKRIVVESEFDPWVYILVSPKMIYAGLPRKAFPRKHAFVDISVFLWLRKQRHATAKIRPRPAQG